MAQLFFRISRTRRWRKPLDELLTHRFHFNLTPGVTPEGWVERRDCSEYGLAHYLPCIRSSDFKVQHAYFF